MVREREAHGAPNEREKRHAAGRSTHLDRHMLDNLDGNLLDHLDLLDDLLLDDLDHLDRHLLDNLLLDDLNHLAKRVGRCESGTAPQMKKA